MRKPTTMTSPKRQATVSVKFTDDVIPDAGSSKQKRQKVATLRRQATVLSGDMVYIPPLQDWPVTVVCTVIPLT